LGPVRRLCPHDRYNVCKRNDLKANPDGWYELYLQEDSPGEDKQSTWQPIVEGKLVLLWRFYRPRTAERIAQFEETPNMKNSCLLMGLATSALLVASSPAAARVFPGSGGSGARPALAPAAVRAAAALHNFNDGNYGDWGGSPSYQFSNPLPQIAAQNRQLGQQAAMQQNMMVQSGIRNTLLTQAQGQTNAVLNQRQANQDWWFQYQGQKMAAQRGGGTGASAALVGVGGFEPADPAPQAAMDIIQWPALLQAPAFASRRAEIEAPYRRSPPGLSVPTTNDYRNMAKTVEQMKDILDWLTRDGVNTQQYDLANACLNKIGQEARERSESSGTSP
jgi:hypothetical protein